MYISRQEKTLLTQEATQSNVIQVYITLQHRFHLHQNLSVVHRYVADLCMRPIRDKMFVIDDFLSECHNSISIPI